MTVSRLLKEFPATVTSDAKARALKTVIGIAVSVGINTGKTVEARTYGGVVSFETTEEMHNSRS